MKNLSAPGAEGPEEPLPPFRALAAATLLVAAVYAYFLIFAQFGFLQQLVLASAGGAALLQPVLAVMGAGGIVASALAAWWHRPERARGGLAACLVMSGLAAGLARFADSTAGFLGTAALVGAGLGGVTVLLAASIRAAVGGRRLGLVLGTGTGLAYGFCNLPPVFHADPNHQAVIALVAAAMGLIAVPGLRRGSPASPPSRPAARAVAAWTIAFLALVWLDSAAFYVIQHNPGLHAATWSGAAPLYMNAFLHLAAAVAAGWCLDRGGLAGVTLAAAVLLAAACPLLAVAPTAAALLYVSGVSFYSTALVYYPAASGRASVAAVIYAVSGWTGSALGIAMVEHRQDIPGWLPALMLAAVAGALGARGEMKIN